MKKIFTCIICFVLLCSFSVLTFAITENNNEEYVELREDQNILLSINSKDAKKYSDNNLIINTINELDSSIHSKKCIEDVEVIFDSSRRTPQREDNVAIIKIALTDFGSKQIEQLIAALKKDENISSAEKDYLFKINDTDNSSTVNVNDTRISEQYAITNTHANMAWAFITGNASVKVGVIDTGINRLHSDLTSNVNTSLSKSFVTGTTAFTDGNGHGTHVAGTIGAVTNNSNGVAGICWNVSIVSLKCFNAVGVANNSNIVSAIEYADANGIKILNCSFGNTNSPTSTDNQNLYNVISHYSGIVIAAAGNDGSTTLNYPAAFNLNNIISVAAVDSSNSLADYSNYGSTVDLAAPGSAILSTKNTTGYTSMSGTSMATPHVTGTVALIFSINPNYSVSYVRNLVLNNTQPIASLTNKVVTGGVLNTFSAVRAAYCSLMGDIDNDGTVSSADARLALRFSVGMENLTAIQKVIADINMDGYVDTDDARSIERISVGLDP